MGDADWATSSCDGIESPALTNAVADDSRLAALRPVLSMAIGMAMDGDELTSIDWNSELSEYNTYLGATFWPGIIVGGLLLLSWLTLCRNRQSLVKNILRCCCYGARLITTNHNLQRTIRYGSTISCQSQGGRQ